MEGGLRVPARRGARGINGARVGVRMRAAVLQSDVWLKKRICCHLSAGKLLLWQAGFEEDRIHCNSEEDIAAAVCT